MKKQEPITPSSQQDSARRSMDAIGPRSNAGRPRPVSSAPAPSAPQIKEKVNKRPLPQKDPVPSQIPSEAKALPLAPEKTVQTSLPSQEEQVNDVQAPRKSRARAVGIGFLIVALIVITATVVFFVFDS